MGSRANDQSGTYIICLFYSALFTLFLKEGEERNAVADCRFYNPNTDVVLHFIGGAQKIQPADLFTNKNLKV